MAKANSAPRILNERITSPSPENSRNTGKIATRLTKKPVISPIPPPTILIAADSVRN